MQLLSNDFEKGDLSKIPVASIDNLLIEFEALQYFIFIGLLNP